MRALVKVSGTLIFESLIYEWLRDEIANRCSEVVELLGAGDQISEEYRRRGIPVEFRNGVRVHATPHAEAIAYLVQCRNLGRVAGMLLEYGLWNVTPEIPVQYENGMRIQLNGDEYVLRRGKEFDEVIVVTAEERLERKQREMPEWVRWKTFPAKSV